MSYSISVVDVSALAPVLAVMKAHRLNDTDHVNPVSQWRKDGESVASDIRAMFQPDAPTFPSLRDAAEKLNTAFRTYGFAYISGHAGPDASLSAELDKTSRDFFHLPSEVKAKLSMKEGGAAWRGHFPLGGELTSGKPDLKEGIYFGLEREAVTADQQADPRRRVLIGPNLFPTDETLPGFRPLVLSYMTDCQALGHGLLMLIAFSLGLDPLHFALALCDDALCLFRIFHYPAASQIEDPALRDLSRELWGVGEHTDYGLLTLLKQDSVGGLEVMHVDGTWMSAPPIDGTLVVNVGDIMEYLTAGYFTSTPHRVRNTSQQSMRLSFPFFFDPALDAELRPLPLSEQQRMVCAENVAQLKANVGKRGRWDNREAVSVGVEEGSTYRDYILGKIGKVFPELAQSQIQ